MRKLQAQHPAVQTAVYWIHTVDCGCQEPDRHTPEVPAHYEDLATAVVPAVLRWVADQIDPGPPVTAPNRVDDYNACAMDGRRSAARRIVAWANEIESPAGMEQT